MPFRAALGGSPPGVANALLGFVVAANLINSASGTAQGGYTPPGDDVVIVGANGSNTAVTLPNTNGAGGMLAVNVGDWIEVTNGTAQACVIFPYTGGTINALAANTSIALAAYARLRCKCIGVNAWQVS